MTIRFRRRVRLAPGVHVNLGKRGASLSMGPRGAKVTLGSEGVRKTVGLPGTGLSHTHYQRWAAEPKTVADASSPSVDETSPEAVRVRRTRWLVVSIGLLVAVLLLILLG